MTFKFGYYDKMIIDHLMKKKKVSKPTEANEYSEIFEAMESHRRDFLELNQSLKRTYQRKRLIAGVIKMGYNEEEIKIVILSKFKEWSSQPTMKKFLTLESLLRPSNFPKYFEACEEEGLFDQNDQMLKQW